LELQKAMSVLSTYLSDPFLYKLYSQVRKAGALRSISLDLTHDCNLRCDGCYYFEEGMDKIAENNSNLDIAFHELVRNELKRGTNFVTVVGGEPSLRLDRLKIIYDNFKMNVATNGLTRIPVVGFENMPIGVSVWGDHRTDAKFRNNGKKDLFEIALNNYKDDPRAFFYYTVTHDKSVEIESVVEQCINNGNKVLFNYYSDLRGEKNDHRHDFEKVRSEIDKMIDRYPEHILTTSYFNKVITNGKIQDQSWSYEVCTNLSTNYKSNEARLKNGNPYNKHFRSYNADFKTTRRCCTGIDRSCDSCFDAWEHFSWIMINMKMHLNSKQEFVHWLTTMYMFYHINGLLVKNENDGMVSEIHKFLQPKKIAL
jgi:MoaA/NifB/PqqE/SkfB family radical SAM enzyme